MEKRLQAGWGTQERAWLTPQFGLGSALYKTQTIYIYFLFKNISILKYIYIYFFFLSTAGKSTVFL